MIIIVHPNLFFISGSADVLNAASGAPSSAPLTAPSDYGDKVPFHTQITPSDKFCVRFSLVQVYISDKFEAVHVNDFG